MRGRPRTELKLCPYEVGDVRCFTGQGGGPGMRRFTSTVSLLVAGV